MKDAATLAVALAHLACSGSSAGTNGAATCQTMCVSQPECESNAGQCVPNCESIESACAASGDTADFRAFVDCETRATYTCASGVAMTQDCHSEFAAVMTHCL